VLVSIDGRDGLGVAVDLEVGTEVELTFSPLHVGLGKDMACERHGRKIGGGLGGILRWRKHQLYIGRG
jgi:hypothetical protein